MKHRLAFFVASLALLIVPGLTRADWFVSAQTKALIVKAESGDADAQFLVGGAYDSGNGAPRNLKEATKWYRMAAEQGHAEAQNSVGSILQEEKRYAEARTWYERAAAQGHAQATSSLGYLYDLGLGVAQDRQKGFEFYSKAADLGWAQAMWNLSIMYGSGQLGQADPVMACVWTARTLAHTRPSERQLTEYAVRVLPQIQRKLSNEQLDECRQKAQDWSPPAIDETSPARTAS